MSQPRSRLAASVSLVALIAAAMPAHATIVTTGIAINPVNAAGNATAGFVGIAPSGTGALEVAAGSVLTMAPGGIDAGQINIGGNQSGTPTTGNGDVTVRGAGSRIELVGVESIINVGRWGGGSTATLNIVEGGVVNMSAGFGVRLGRGNTNAGFGIDGATGIARVDGAGSMLAISGVDGSGVAGGIAIGRDEGFGRLTISNGGTVVVGSTSTTSSAFLSIGGRPPGSDPALASSSGSDDLLVTGAGSRLSMTGNGAGITVGNFGATSVGNLGVVAGGRVEAMFLSTGVGSSSANGATGTTTIDGPGSSVHLIGRGRAGEAPGGTVGDDLGRGTMIVRNGGNLVIDASQATTSGGGFNIGRDGGVGALLIESGGGMSIGGNTAGGMGLTAGRAGGTGSIELRSGATLRIDTPAGPTATGSGITLGRDAGSTGSMRVDAARVELDVNHDRASAFRSGFFVGRGGTGTLDLANGGSIIVDGREILSTVVQAGGNYSSDLANRVQGDGRITVSGAGSRLEMRGDDTNIEIGRWGAASRGELVVANGGAVAANTLRIGMGQSGADGATGRATVAGAGSTLALGGRDIDGDGGQIWLGRDRGKGELVVAGGARVTLDASSAAASRSSFINIGGRSPFVDSVSGLPVAGTSGTASVLVTGAGTRIDFLGAGGAEGAGGSINVGRWGTDTDASMTIADRAAVTTTFLSIGRGESGADGARGSMRIDDAALRLAGASAAGTGAFLSVGRDAGGRGFLVVDNGGTVALDPAAATAAGSKVGVAIARSAGSTGDVLLDHGASLRAAQFLGVGATYAAGDVQEGGAGVLTLRNGATASAHGVHVGAAGRVVVSAGTLSANEVVLRGSAIAGGSQLVLDVGIVRATTFEAFAGAGITGVGLLDVGTVTLHAGATLGPGFSPGIIRIAGDLVAEAGARLMLDFVEAADGSIARDVIEVAGLLDARAEVEILLGGTATFADVLGQSLSMFLVDEAGIGLGSTYEGRVVTVVDTDGIARRVTVVDSILTDGTPASDVAEPGTLALMLLGGSALIAGRGRRRE
ncbi:MAG: hypothetical protein JNK67_11185 [Alphaproteobacteria bacterium]|nr:hypothetical protein [Alphaproteobacteria bacterium]